MLVNFLIDNASQTCYPHLMGTAKKHYRTFAQLNNELRYYKKRLNGAFERLNGVEKLCLKFYTTYMEEMKTVEYIEGYKQALMDERWGKKRGNK